MSAGAVAEGPATMSGPGPRVIALAAFVRRDWVIMRSYRLPFAMDLASTAFMLALFFFLGRLVDQAEIAALEGIGGGYFAFAIVGMAVLRLVQSALQSFTTKMRHEQTTGTLEALLATPASPSLVILCSAGYDLTRAMLTSALMVAVAVPLGLRSQVTTWSLLAIVATLVALLAVFAALGVVVASFGLVFKQTGPLIALITSGLALLGGVYFPVEVLPEALQWLAHALPFTWGVDLLRAGLLTGTVDGPRLALLAAAAVVGLPVALWLFDKAVVRARKTGTLSDY